MHAYFTLLQCREPEARDVTAVELLGTKQTQEATEMEIRWVRHPETLTLSGGG